jgi:hypothetical protein
MSKSWNGQNGNLDLQHGIPPWPFSRLPHDATAFPSARDCNPPWLRLSPPSDGYLKGSSSLFPPPILFIIITIIIINNSNISSILYWYPLNDTLGTHPSNPPHHHQPLFLSFHHSTQPSNMSNIIHKVKDAVTGHKDKSEAPEGSHGPHDSKVGNAADPRVDSDRDHRAAAGSTTGTTGSTTTTTGPTVGAGHSSTGREGPHSSDLANKADPRIDSDRSGTTLGNTAGDVGGSGREGVAGPHGNRIMNAADPRVDSDRDASRTVGSTGAGTTGTHGTTGSGLTGSHGTTGSGLTGSHGTTGTTGSGLTSGASAATGAHTGAHGAHGTSTGTGATSGSTYNSSAGSHGPHGKVGNIADPRVDSDRDHRGAPGGAGTSHLGSGPGPASNTAGPHKSDMMNKADPRVDSDLDGSKTVGGNKTYTA